MLTAIETIGTINTNHQIELDEELPANAPNRVRVIVLFDDIAADIPEGEWLSVASNSGAFDFLTDESEDIYSPEDGKPFVNEK